MSMKIKVDEDLPKTAVEILQASGHEATGATEQGMGEWKDGPLWQAIQAEHRLLITRELSR
jgi:predicted nuclease of predicted toxin-antitoxin system